MYHHAESPEVVQATRAEYERTVARHMAERAAERLLVSREDEPEDGLARHVLARLRDAFGPAHRRRQLPSG